VAGQCDIAVDIYIGRYVCLTARAFAAATVCQGNYPISTDRGITDINPVTRQLKKLHLNIFPAGKSGNVFFVIGKANIAKVAEIPLTTNIEVGRFKWIQEGVPRSNVV